MHPGPRRAKCAQHSPCQHPGPDRRQLDQGSEGLRKMVDAGRLEQVARGQTKTSFAPAEPQEAVAGILV